MINPVKTKPENPPAFPNEYDSGMTLRDYFAAKAMQGYLRDEHHDGPVVDYGDVAEIAYAIADAMLAERSKP